MRCQLGHSTYFYGQKNVGLVKERYLELGETARQSGQ